MIGYYGVRSCQILLVRYEIINKYPNWKECLCREIYGLKFKKEQGHWNTGGWNKM